MRERRSSKKRARGRSKSHIVERHLLLVSEDESIGQSISDRAAKTQGFERFDQIRIERRTRPRGAWRSGGPMRLAILSAAGPMSLLADSARVAMGAAAPVHAKLRAATSASTRAPARRD